MNHLQTSDKAMVRGVMVSSQMNISENKISKLEEISKEWPGRKKEN